MGHDPLTPAAIEALYRSHGHVAFRRARSLLGSDDDAHDAVQAVFSSLLHKPEQFGGFSKPSTFLYSAVTHHCWTKLRDARNRVRLLSARGKPVNEVAARAENLSMLRQVMGRLPLELVELAVFAYLDDMTHAEIATIVGKSRTRVTELLQEFRQQAQALLLTTDQITPSGSTTAQESR
jgi:RNA polymerase sigma factor (sigma-70 family)